MAFEVDRRLTVTNVTANEGNSGTTLFTFTISAIDEPLNPLEHYSDITFGFRTTPPALDRFGEDLVPIVNGQGHIAASQTSMTVTVQVLGDANFESDETFFLDIFNVRYDSSRFGASLSGRGTIVNDDRMNTRPIITSPASYTISENSVDVGFVRATDPDPNTTLRYSLSGQDAAMFVLDSVTGALRFRTAPDFEAPGSLAGTNKYLISVGATDGLDPAINVNVAVDVLNVSGLNLTGTAAGDRLDGTGEPDFIRGLDGNDVIHGLGDDDTLTGGLGNDVLDGGAGIDTAIYADAAKAVKVDLSLSGIQNTLGGGKDTLIGIENLVGSAYNDTLHGDGARNVLEGGDGNDKIDGSAGADRMSGGYGNDSFWVDDAGDVVVDELDGGRDKVYAGVDFTLSNFVEDLFLTGNDALTGTGNALDNTLTANDAGNALLGGAGNDTLKGGAGADRLNGGEGRDVLTGGAGADTFVLDNRELANRVDTIRDFVSGIDRIEISTLAFGALLPLGPGALDPGELAYGLAATTADQHLIYNPASGILYYDADGLRGASAVPIAMLAGHSDLQAGDIWLV